MPATAASRSAVAAAPPRVGARGLYLKLALLAALALALRLGFVVAYTPDQLGFNDQLFYHATASLLADGQGFTFLTGEPTAHWPPALPFLLSLVYRGFGAEPSSAVVLNAFIGAATVPLLYAVALRNLGRREAAIAALALAVMPGQILFADTILSETLFTFALVGFLALLTFLPNRRWAIVALGAFVGLAALTRGEGLLLPVIPLAIWWRELPRRRVLAGRIAVLLATAALVIAPWTIRNAIAMDAFVPISTNASATLWSGHNSEATGGPSYAPPSLLARVDARGKDFEVAEARLLRREALSYMVSHPLHELALIPLKLIHLTGGDSQVIDIWINGEGPQPVGQSRGARDRSEPVIGGAVAEKLRLVADLAWYALLTATLASLAVFGRRLLDNRILRGVLALFALSLLVYGFVYYGNFRYRIPLEPLMMLVAAPLAVRIWELRRGLSLARGT